MTHLPKNPPLESRFRDRPTRAGFWLAGLLMVIAAGWLGMPMEAAAQINLPTLGGNTADENDIIETAKSYFSAILELVIYILYAVVFIGGSYIIISAFLEAKNSKAGWGGFMLTFVMTIAGVALSVYFLSLGLTALENIS